MSENDGHLLLTAEQVAEMLQMKKDWVYAQVRAGALPSVPMGGRLVRFRREAIEEWIASRERSVA